MIHIINFTIKILLTLICLPIVYLNLLIVLIVWNGDFFVVGELFDLIWEKSNKTKER
jgi:hypothetical protein